MLEKLLDKSIHFAEEKVYIETSDYIIRGTVSISVDVSPDRRLSELLNSGKDFIAVKNCKLENKRLSDIKEIESVKFLEVNRNVIHIVKYL